jgi:signal transduction histidine kinase/ligand-binding sensor domain-containing protein
MTHARRSWIHCTPKRPVAKGLLLLVTLVLTSLAMAQSPPALQHTAYSAADGAPADIWAMTQSSDGYLWLGTGGGLYRFDGVRFERFSDRTGHSLPASNLTALTLAPNGNLWVGYFASGISQIKNGEVESFTVADGLPGGWVSSFAAEASGTVWASMEGGLARFSFGRWITVGDDWGFHGKHAGGVLLDPDGNLWVTGRDHIYVLRKDTRRFVQTSVEVDMDSQMARSSDGTLWVADRSHGTRALPGLSVDHTDIDQQRPPPDQSHVESVRLLFDHLGRLWGTDPIRGGVYLIEHPASVADGHALVEGDLSARFSANTGMTSEADGALFEDAEHNVWVGTNFGLDSFRAASIVVVGSLPTPGRYTFNVSVDKNGTAWIISNTTLFHWANDHLVWDEEFPTALSHLYADPTDTLWFDHSNGMYRRSNGKTISLALPQELSRASGTAKTTDGAGGLWENFNLEGIFHFTQDRWIRCDPGIPNLGDVASMATGPAGKLWLGLTGDRIVSFDGTTRQVFSTRDGQRLGAVLSLDVRDDDVLAGGESGVTWNTSGSFHSVAFLGSLPLSGVSGIARDHTWVWLNTNIGLVRIALKELRQVFKDASYIPEYRLFDSHDGLPGIAVQAQPTNTLQIDSAGRVWIETNKGLAFIDPRNIRTNPIEPPVSIRYIEADEKKFNPVAGVTLPELTRRVHIAFTAASLSVPVRVRFRYRLDGIDTTWQEAGKLREAFYTNLKPGSYHFHAIAANEDGLWNKQGASLAFTIASAFYQTWWFAVASILACVGLVFVVLRLRVRRITGQLRIRLEDRHLERERIAHQLNDTLLQSIQALVLRFQVGTERLPRTEPSRLFFEEALDLADRVIVEARDRVAELRAPAESVLDLADALEELGNQMAAAHGFAFRFFVRGEPHLLHSLIAEECLSIIRGALSYVAQHTSPTQLEVTVAYRRRGLWVSVSDNGSGIDKGSLEGDGHAYAEFSSMRDRAQRLGGRLSIETFPDQGSTILLAVPGRRAFANRLLATTAP